MRLFGCNLSPVIVLATLSLAGCSFAQPASRPQHGYAFVRMATLREGEAAVRVLRISSTHRLLNEWIGDPPPALLVRPGRYILELDCFREGGLVALHGGFDYEASFHADQSYLLDCAPDPGKFNNFSLQQLP